MEKIQSDSGERSRDLTTTSLLLRVILGGMLSAVVLTAFAFLSASSRAAVLSGQNLLIRVVSGVLYVAVMTPLARRVFYRRFPRFLAIFVPLYITGTLTDLIEAYFYTTLLTPFSLIAALIIEGLPLLLIAGIIAWLIPATEEARSEPRFLLGLAYHRGGSALRSDLPVLCHAGDTH
jgi:hypothetical protein